MIEFLLIILFLFLLAFLLIFKSKNTSIEIENMKKDHLIPDGKIIYTDLDKPARNLFSKELNLVGKPDYIVKRGGAYIPVEIKTTKTDKPFKNHILQLAAYWFLLEKEYKREVPYGIIDYKGQQYVIPFNEDLKNELEKMIKEMRNGLRNNKVQRNHNFIKRCSFCSFKDICNQKIS